MLIAFLNFQRSNSVSFPPIYSLFGWHLFALAIYSHPSPRLCLYIPSFCCRFCRRYSVLFLFFVRQVTQEKGPFPYSLRRKVGRNIIGTFPILRESDIICWSVMIFQFLIISFKIIFLDLNSSISYEDHLFPKINYNNPRDIFIHLLWCSIRACHSSGPLFHCMPEASSRSGQDKGPSLDEGEYEWGSRREGYRLFQSTRSLLRCLC